MIRLKLARWQTLIVYVGFALFSFVAGFYLTFPYEALKQRIVDESDQLSLHVRIREMGMGLFGITASGVEVSRKIDPRDEKPPESIVLDSIAFRPTLLPPGINLRARVLGGMVSGTVGGFSLLRMLGTPAPGKRDSVGNMSISLHAENLNLATDALKKVFGVDLSGSAASQLTLVAPVVPANKSYDLDWTQASGNLAIDLKDVTIRGGTVTVPVEGEPTPIDLPRITVGNVEGKLKFDKGTGSVEKMHIKSDDLELAVSGGLKLARKLDYSVPDLQIRLKTEAEFTKRLGAIGMGIAQLPNDPTDPNFRLVKVSGFLGRPMVTNVPGFR